MRITLDIDDDVLLVAKELAKRERKTAGKLMSDLLREAMGGRATGVPATSGRELYGFSPHVSPSAAMIAQDFFRVRVLASGSIAVAYGVASTCPHAEKIPARARQRGLYRAEPPRNERI